MDTSPWCTTFGRPSLMLEKIVSNHVCFATGEGNIKFLPLSHCYPSDFKLVTVLNEGKDKWFFQKTTEIKVWVFFNLCQSQLVKIVTVSSSIQGGADGLCCLMEGW